MKSRMLLLFIVLLCVATLSAQTKMIESFDVPADSISVSNYNSGKWTMESAESANPDSNYQKLTWVEDPVYQGEKALRVEYRIQDSESWGGYSKFMISKEDSSDVFDFSGYDTLSFMYYIEEQISSGSLSFRLNLADCADSEQGNQPATNASCEYYYSLNDNILNESTPTGQWIEQKIAIESNASWDGSGFNL